MHSLDCCLYLCGMEKGINPLQGYIGVSDFARLAGVAHLTVLRWIRKRWIAAEKIGHFWAIHVDELEKAKRRQALAQRAARRRRHEYLLRQVVKDADPPQNPA